MELRIRLFIILLLISTISYSSQNDKNKTTQTPTTVDANWKDFPYPKINFKNETLNGNGALYKKLIPNPEAFIQQTCLEVCQFLYPSVDKIKRIDEINYKVHDYKGVSGKDGSAPVINISFSSSYLKDISKKMTKEEMLAEIKGVLVHEITHGYQPEPKGIGTYFTNKEFYSFIEGEADAVRIKAGLVPMSARKPGGSWMDGYKTTGFFINWLETKEKNFMLKLNATCNVLDKWGWEKVAQIFFNKSIEELWQEYQDVLLKEKK
jgi:hypothetical protein